MTSFTPEDVAKEAEKKSTFWKLSEGDVLKGYYIEPELQSRPSEFTDQNTGEVNKTIRYGGTFRGALNNSLEPHEKDLYFSDGTIKDMLDACLMVEQKWGDSKFAIKRTGVGKATRWKVQVIGKRDNPISALREESIPEPPPTTPDPHEPEPPAPKDSEVPF